MHYSCYILLHAVYHYFLKSTQLLDKAIYEKNEQSTHAKHAQISFGVDDVTMRFT